VASISKSITIDAETDQVWDALRDFGALHERLVSGFVVATELHDDTRVITFANGAVAHERLVTIDDAARRLVYSVVRSPLGGTHDNSAAQVCAAGEGRTTFVWTKDVLPDAIAPRVSALMDQGLASIKATLERR
jgi:hypothetical protein